MYTITINSPLYNITGGASGITENINAVSFSISKEIGRADMADLFIHNSVAEKYFIEDLATNPIQLNSTVEIKKGLETLFFGHVIQKPEEVTFDERYLHVTCADPLFNLSNTLCPLNSNGNYIWSLATDTYEVLNIPMLLFDPYDEGSVPIGEAVKYYGSFSQQTLWANPADANGAKCYVSGNTATCAAFNSTAEQIELTSSGAAFGVRGWIKIDAEWIYYPTVWYESSTGKWYLGKTGTLPCYRGRLGTAAVGHLAGTTATNMLPKYMAPALNYLQYINDGLTYVDATYKTEYLPVSKDGCFVYSGEIHKTSSPTTLRPFQATFTVYDDDLSFVGTGGNRVSVTDIIKRILQGDGTGAPETTREAGGAGIPDSMLDIDSYFDTLYITRFSLTGNEKQPQTAKVIQSLFNSLSLIATQGVYSQDEVAFYFDHATKKFVVKYLPNVISPTYTINGVSSIQKDMTLDDLYSAVNVEYEEDQSNNILNVDRSWHEACGGAGQPTYYSRAAGKPVAKWDDVDATTDTNAGNFGHDAMIWWTKDGTYTIEETRCTQYWDTAPSGPNTVPHSYWWFGDNGESAIIDSIRLLVGTWRFIGSWQTVQNPGSAKVKVRVVGCNTWNPVTHTPLFSSGGWEDIIVPQYLPYTETPYYYEIKLNGDEILNRGSWNCIAILFEYMSGFKTPDTYVAPVYLFDVVGSSKGKKQAYIQLSDTVEDDIYKVYYPNAYNKMRGGIGASATYGGFPKVLRYKISGGCSEGAAISIGRLLLESKLIYFSLRNYSYAGAALPSIPKLGEALTAVEDIRYGAVLPVVGRYEGELFVDTSTGGGFYKWAAGSWTLIQSGYSPSYTGIVRRCVYTVAGDGAKLDLSLLNYAGDVIA